MRYQTHQVKTRKTARFVVNLFQGFLGYKILNEINFTNNQALPAWLSHSRLSAATYWNSQKLLTEVAVNIPRFEYVFDGFNWNPEGLLIEKQSTNLVANSMALGNLSVFNGVRALGDTYSDLQGYTITSNNGSVTSRITQTLSTQAWQPFIAVSSIVKNGDSKGAMLIGSGGPRTHYAYADLTARTVSPKFTIDQPTYIQGEVKSLSNDRYSINAVFDISTEGESTVGDVGVGAGSTVNGLITTAYALQLEQAKYASSYIKTGSSPVTRAADKLQLNANKYTGSVLVRYKRQDSGLTETKWIDYTGVTNPNLADQLPVGAWVKSIKQFSRVLKSTEKQFEDFYSNALVDFNALLASSLPSSFNLSRLSKGTYLDVTGNMKEVNQNAVRFDFAFNDAYWYQKGLLIEKAATNIIGNSDLAAGIVGWNTNDAQVNYTVKPNGTIYVEGLRAGTDRPVFLNPEQFRIVNIPVQVNTTVSAYLAGSKTVNYNYVMRFTTGNSLFGPFNNMVTTDKTIDPLKHRTSLTFKLNTPVNNGDILLGTNVVSQWLNIGYVQAELGSYPTSWIRTSNAAVTRAKDNLQLNVSNYTGSVRLVYQRQDTNAIETKWIDYKNQTNPIISDQLDVGVWLRRVVVYNRTLTLKEKANV